jgi:hypothetical protein
VLEAYPGRQLAGEISRAAAALRALGVAGAPPASQILVGGPAAPSDPGPLRLAAARLWGDAALAAPALAAPALAAPAAPAAPAAEILIAQMTNTVAAHVRAYGAAPDFTSMRPAAREKIYNYIRSTTATPNAPDNVVEEVRRRLAGIHSAAASAHRRQ